MQSLSIASWRAMSDQVAPAMVAPLGGPLSQLAQLSVECWRCCQRIPIDNYDHRALVYCSAMVLARRYLAATPPDPTATPTLLAETVYLINDALLSHPLNVIEPPPDHPTVPLALAILRTLGGRLYHPSIINYYLLEHQHRWIDAEAYEFAAYCNCCWTASIYYDRVDPLDAARALIVLVRIATIETDNPATLVEAIDHCYQIDSNVTSQNVQSVYEAVVKTPIANWSTPEHDAVLMVYLQRYAANLEKYQQCWRQVQEAVVPTTSASGSRKSPRKVRVSSTPKIAAATATGASSLTVVKILGSGAYGTVAKVKTTQGKTLASKCQQHLTVYLREVALMASLKHHNLMGLAGFDPMARSFQMTCQPYRLDVLIRDHALSWSNNRHALQQLWSGLAYLHSVGVIHGDIKPNNILLTSKYVVKIADFGLSIAGCSQQRREMPSRYVTWQYRALELYQDSTAEYSFGVDVWAVAAMALEMYHKGYFAANEAEMLEGIQSALEDGGVDVTYDLEDDIGLMCRQCFLPPAMRPHAWQSLSLISL
jgi:tRNA A-37 threonylcarbamoyl transferase component Bud32